MKRSREQFENSPDTGFFGKTFTRIWNFTEVYIYRFFLVGLLLCLIIYPLAIIINVSFSICFALTSFVWIPIYLLLR